MYKLVLIILLFVSSAFASDGFQVKILDITNPSGSQDSSVIDISQYRNYSLQVIPAGTLAVTGVIYVSNDASQPTNFTSLTSSSQSITAAGGSFVYNMNNANYKFMKFNISSISGTGRIYVQMQAKKN